MLAARLVADMNQEPVFDGVNVDGTVFFSAVTDDSGLELWRTDGTADETRLVKDIRSGPEGSQPTELTNVNGVLYFSADDGVSGRELWRSDGTEEGTFRVKDMVPGKDASNPIAITANGDDLYFVVGDLTSVDRELWRSDGTESGTEMIVQYETPTFFGGPQPRLEAAGGKVFFSVGERSTRPDGFNSLWTTDGTSVGTRIVEEELDWEGFRPYHIDQIVPVGNSVFFTPHNGARTGGLWWSDGQQSKIILDDVWFPQLVGSGNSIFFPYKFLGDEAPNLWTVDTATLEPTKLAGFAFRPTVAGDVVYFNGGDEQSGQELWASDGTLLGTRMVVDLVPGPESSHPFDLTPVGDTLFFSAADQDGVRRSWKTDGTPAGTIPVELPTDVLPDIVQTEGEAVVFATPEDNAHVLRHFDGEVAQKVATPPDLHFPTASAGHWATSHGLAGNVIFQFNASQELFSSDGTAEGTRLLAEFGTFPSYTSVGNRLFVVTRNVDAGWAIWVADEELRDFELVKETDASHGSSVSWLTATDEGIFFFTSEAETELYNLWFSDGSEEGTSIIGEGFTYGNSTVATTTHVWFESNGNLWQSDGSAEGTTAVAGLSCATFGRCIAVAEDGVVYVNKGGEIRFSDGAAEGHRVLGNVGSASRIDYITTVGDRVLFWDSRDRLWVSDGTQDRPIALGDFCFSVRPIALGDRLVFLTCYGEELWSTDGTPEGTGLLLKTHPGDFSPSVEARAFTQMTVVNDELYIVANDGRLGMELWRSDGTPEGTRVIDIRPGGLGSNPYLLSGVGDRLFFLADDGVHGHELWVYEPDDASDLLAGDANGDGTVEFADFLILSANYGRDDEAVTFDVGDFDGDGQVQFSDFLILSANFGRTREPGIPTALSAIHVDQVFTGSI